MMETQIQEDEVGGGVLTVNTRASVTEKVHILGSQARLSSTAE